LAQERHLDQALGRVSTLVPGFGFNDDGVNRPLPRPWGVGAGRAKRLTL